MIKNNLFWSRI